jgi:hypothetical protein
MKARRPFSFLLLWYRDSQLCIRAKQKKLACLSRRLPLAILSLQ